MTPTKILVIANRTADSPDLLAALRQRAAERQSRFTLLVPAVPHGLAWAADMKAGWTEAARRAESAGIRMRQAGLVLEDVIVGDPDPLAAAGDAIHAREIDEVVVSPLPRTISRWLSLGLPARLRRSFDLPIQDLIAGTALQPLPDLAAEEAVAA